MLTGSCLCGAIHYQIDISHRIDNIIFCHCKRCQKWSGSAFNAAMPVEIEKFTLLRGKQQIKSFAVNGVNRFFCLNCGSNLFTSRDNAPQIYRLRIGTLDTDIDVINKIHIYSASKAIWDTICNDGEEFTEGMIV